MVAPPPRDRRRRRHGFSDRLSTGLLHPSLAFRCRRRSAARLFFAIDRFSRGANWRSIIAGSYYSPAPFSLSDCSLCSGSTTQRPWFGAAIRQASWISPPMRPIRLSDDTAGCAWGERLKDLAFLQADDDRRSAIGAERRILFDVCCATARSARKCRLSKNRPGAQ